MRYELKLCPQCGMDAGVRKMTETEPAKYFVKCELCGYMTKGCKSQSAASSAWNKEAKNV